MPDTDDIAVPTLAELGWTDRETALFAPLADAGLVPGRVSRVDRSLPLIITENGALRAEPATHLLKSHGTGTRAVVGDWVGLSIPEGHDQAIIEAILPRKSAFSRKDPGEQTDEQVLIANVDVVFVVQSLSGGGINVRRLERELVLAWETGATPVVVLTKADIADDIDDQRNLAEEVAYGVDVIVESAVTRDGLDEVHARIGPGVTAALLGGSGVGKSTLVNSSWAASCRQPSGPQERRQGSPYDGRSRDRARARRRRHHRHARHAGDRAVGRRGRHRERVSRHRRARRALPVPRLPPRERARLRGARRGRRPASCRSGGSTATGRSSRSSTELARRQDREGVGREGAHQQGDRQGRKRFYKNNPGKKQRG